MPKFEVEIREVHVITVPVEAADENEARDKVSAMLEDDVHALIEEHTLVYSHTMEPWDWPARIINDVE
jgi:hypothetical protein